MAAIANRPPCRSQSSFDFSPPGRSGVDRRRLGIGWIVANASNNHRLMLAATQSAYKQESRSALHYPGTSGRYCGHSLLPNLEAFHV